MKVKSHGKYVGKMRYFLCRRKYLPLIAAESLISLCLSHPFLGMLSVPGFCVCSRLQRVIYFLLTIKKGRIISRRWLLNCPDCFVTGEEAWVLVASGLTLSKHTEKDSGEREGFSCNTKGIGQFPWQQTAVEGEFASSEGSVSLRQGGQNSLPALSSDQDVQS